jgi:hypothetical protein
MTNENVGCSRERAAPTRAVSAAYAGEDAGATRDGLSRKFP